MQEAYIVTSIRTPGGKANKGAFKDTRPEDLLAFILDAAVARTPGLAKEQVDDIIIGCAFPEAEQGFNIGRVGACMAGFPYATGGATINRFCSSGLEAIAQAVLRVRAGWSDVTIGGGVESMSYVPLGGHMPRPHPQYAAAHPDLYVSMGITAETVATRYDISRLAQDEFACRSHEKAAAARAAGRFSEIVPTPATRFAPGPDGLWRRDTVVQTEDDGIRPDTTVERLASLNPVFAAGGSVTAGNSSQTTDGAAATVVMSETAMQALGLTPLARLVGYTVVGCRPDEMGVGPRFAIPKLLDRTGVAMEEVGLFEINEAFAAQAVHCLRELGLDRRLDRVNVKGGAIALGHPLGCTGAKLCATLLATMRERGVRYGVESMCVGGGMGAAALFESCG